MLKSWALGDVAIGAQSLDAIRKLRKAFRGAFSLFAGEQCAFSAPRILGKHLARILVLVVFLVGILLLIPIQRAHPSAGGLLR